MNAANGNAWPATGHELPRGQIMTNLIRFILSAFFTAGLSVSALAQNPPLGGCPQDPVPPPGRGENFQGHGGWWARLANDSFAIVREFEGGWNLRLVHYDNDPNWAGVFVEVPWWDRDLQRPIRIGLSVDGQVLMDDTSVRVINPTTAGMDKVLYDYRLFYGGRTARLVFRDNDSILLSSPVSPVEISNLADAAALFDTVRACRNSR